MQLIKKSLQTPIEIALRIDENGMTTARKLYEFLELEKKNYSRWCKLNIVGNEFAEEGVDFFPFVINEECGGQATTDYKITSSFAKKLSMTAKNEKGEIARQYFIQTEGKLKEVAVVQQSLSPELQMFQQIFNAVAKQELEVRQIKEQSQKAIDTSQAIKDTIIGVYDNWRAEMKHFIASIQKNSDLTYQEVYNNLYDDLEKRARCDLSARVRNGRGRLLESGSTKTQIEAYGRMDVIEADTRLKEIFTTITKEYVIKYVA